MANESIQFGFQGAGGQLIRVTDFDHETEGGGVVLEHETSALPRGVAIRIRPAESVTEEQVDSVRLRRGWPPGGMRLDMERKDSWLRLAGEDAGALPAGRYAIQIRVGGLRPVYKPFCTIPVGGKLCLKVREPALKHRFELSGRPFDAGTGEILNSSPLDGQGAVAWLNPDSRIGRDRRKACLLNILAKLATVPSTEEPLNRYVERIEVVEPDRVYARVSPGFFATVREKFLKKDRMVHASHKRLLRRFNLDPRDYRLESYREPRAEASLQIVGAVPRQRDGASKEVNFVDIDLDCANPRYDVWRALLHWGHLFRTGKTNHLKLRRNELNQGAAEASPYYEAVERSEKRA